MGSLKCTDIALIEQMLDAGSSSSSSQSYTFTRKGNLNNKAWLYYGKNFSNVTGAPYTQSGGKLVLIETSQSEQNKAFTLEIWHHTGNLANDTLLLTVAGSPQSIDQISLSQIMAANGNSNVVIPPNVCLAVKKISGSAKDLAVVLKVEV